MASLDAGKLITDPVAILGFGFIGLAFIMAILAYSALKEVIKAENQRESVVKLARFYMALSVVFLLCAGPLQFGLLWAQYTFSAKQPINIKIGMVNTTWKNEAYGEVGIMRNGKFHPFVSEALVESFADGEEVNVQLDRVIDAFKLMEANLRAQIVVVDESRTSIAHNTSITATPPSTDPAAAAQFGG